MEPTRAIVIAPDISQRNQAKSTFASGAIERSAAERLVEAEGLALAIDLVIAHSAVINVAKPRPATLLGSGKVIELAEIVKAENAKLVVIDHALTPVQQRNLEKELHAKVVDRTGLILEIFGRRARTKEGSLQVELAHLNYQRGRLVRSWTHLERQRGGAGFLGGPGETQIEADRRLLRDKIKSLEVELEAVRRTRTLHRAKRKKIPLPVVAFVGYTNAGKSTLFNRLTGADVHAEDMLFATLDPTLRRVQLPGGTWIILSDTVGFISDLPTHLVAAFRATLEEVQEANLVLHVHDAADSAVSAQADDVRQVLKDLEIAPEDTSHIIEVWNKIDALLPEDREAIQKRLVPSKGDTLNQVAVSALDGTGLPDLLALIEQKIAGSLVSRTVEISPDHFADVAWLYENGIVRGREALDDGMIVVRVDLTPENSEAYDRRTKG
ncbi:GTPase HflX [Ahrensia sp. 13_GOM-1096m]|uniref:GTPase HflX n=1 Tax=Ahrensia sp. 13_GOM-1096m TaxID=1380380 RepID=UPI0005505D80|nr:GTPase HflX [Ahrensia sp. 13_GOM-1096m]